MRATADAEKLGESRHLTKTQNIMPFQDVNNNHISPTDEATVKASILTIENTLAPYLRNLTPEENTKYGFISEKNKLFVNKDMEYHQNRPALDSPDVDWTEFEADWRSRSLLEWVALRLNSLAAAATETRRLHDYDNYQNALLDYAYAQYKDRTQPGMGYDSKVQELGQFFEKEGNGGEPTPENP